MVAGGFVCPVRRLHAWISAAICALFPRSIRIAIICGNLSPHLSTAKDGRVGTWAKASSVEIAATSTNSSWLNRIEAMFAALRYFALDGTGHASRKEQPA